MVGGRAKISKGKLERREQIVLRGEAEGSQQLGRILKFWLMSFSRKSSVLEEPLSLQTQIRTVLFFYSYKN